jgi:rubrerythrin
MELLTTKVVIVEDNRTRADLYTLWLEDCEVTVALTERQVESAFEDTLALAMVDHDFADGAASGVLAMLRERMPACQILGMRDRADGFPDLPTDQHLVKPVFEKELQELAERLIYRANYHYALRLYYQTTSNLIYHEVNDGGNRDEKRCERLRGRVERLRELIRTLKSVLDEDDVQAVRKALTFETESEGRDARETTKSKYRPDRCSRCRTDWDRENVVQLGANIWRCRSCGHVQMKTDPSHRGIGSYRL